MNKSTLYIRGQNNNNMNKSTLYNIYRLSNIELNGVCKCVYQGQKKGTNINKYTLYRKSNSE